MKKLIILAIAAPWLLGACVPSEPVSRMSASRPTSEKVNTATEHEQSAGGNGKLADNEEIDSSQGDYGNVPPPVGGNFEGD